MHACTHFLHLGAVVDSDTLFYVLLLPTGLKQCSPCVPGGPSPWPQRALEEQGMRPSLQDADHGHWYVISRGCNETATSQRCFSLHWMSCFNIYSQIKNQRRADEKIIIAYEILCLSMKWCTDQRHGLEKTSVPDALALLNMNDARHLECIVWTVYNGALLVGLRPELQGVWCWLGYISISTGAAMMWPIACHTH